MTVFDDVSQQACTHFVPLSSPTLSLRVSLRTSPSSSMARLEGEAERSFSVDPASILRVVVWC